MVHATAYVGQYDASYPKLRGDIRQNLAVILMLLCCSHHLLTQHILTQVICYYINRYSDEADIERFAKHRAAARSLAGSIRRSLSKPARTLTKEFCGRW